VQLEELTSKLLTAQEHERQRIARDLHDDVSQRLAALVLEVASLERRPSAVPAELARALGPLREQLEHLSDDVHTLAYRLHPSRLTHLSQILDVPNAVIESERIRAVVATVPPYYSIPVPVGLRLFDKTVRRGGAQASHSGGDAGTALYDPAHHERRLGGNTPIPGRPAQQAIGDLPHTAATRDGTAGRRRKRYQAIASVLNISVKTMVP